MLNDKTISPWAKSFTRRRRLAAVPVSRLSEATGINRMKLLNLLGGFTEAETEQLDAALEQLGGER